MPSKTNRLHNITVHTDNSTINTFYPVAFCGASGINQSDNIDILVFTYNFIESNACLSLINAPICLTTFSADRTASCRTGLIRGIRYQQSDGAMHFYTLEVVSPDWQLAQSIHTRSFINQSTLDIVTLILSDYDLNWQISESLLSSDDESSARLSAPLYMRTQSDASDYEFVTGLLADIGISTLWVSGNSVDELGTWWLVDGLDTGELIPLTYSYAQSYVQSGQDSVHTLQMRSQQLGSDRVIVRADGLAADTIYEGQAVDESPLATDDTTVLIGAPSRVHSDDAAAHLAQQWISANHCQRETYQATGAMRGLSVGSPVSINNLPSIGSLSTHCIAVTLIGIEPDNDSVSYHHQVFIKQWLQRTAQHMHCHAMNHSQFSIPDHGFDIARDTGVWVSATLLDAAIPYCPYPSSLSFASSTYTGLTQARTGDTGLSASPSYDSSVSTDNLQQTITTPVWSGISPHNDGTTPPLRSLQLSSGSTHGWQFAPRLGQSVLLNHWYGDIDSPVISRSFYDGIGMGDVDDKDITTRDAGLSNRHNLQGGASPRWHGGGLGHSQISEDDTHSGWISGIAQYGLTADSEVAMSFDDTPNKVGLQWTVNNGTRANAETPTITSSATFAPDEHIVALGTLRHRFSNHQSNDSGQGINVATDHGLQITGDTGVLLSTFDIRHTQTEHESAWVNDAGQQQLKLGAELSETFKEAKQAHLQSTAALSDANQTIEAFKTSAQIIDETLNTEVLGAANVLLVSKDSILASASNTLWTAKTIVRQSGATQSDVVAGNYTLTANTIDSLSGVGGQVDLSGLHISANREPLAVQAQGGELQLHSQRGMTIGSESGQVNVSSPKRIKLQTSAGASITIDDSGIKLVCPGMIKVQAVKKGLVAGGRVTVKVLDFLSSDASMSYYLIDSATERVLKNRRYRMINPHNGHITLGKSDNSGKIEEHHPNILLEILPELSRTYTQDIGGNLPNIIATAAPSPEKNILTAKDLNSLETILKNLKAKNSTFKADYNRRISGGYNLDSVPIVPNGAKLVSFNKLLKLKAGTSDNMFYKSFDGFAGNETNFHKTIDILEGDRYLPHSYYYVYAHGSNRSILWVNTRDLDPVQRALNITKSKNQYVTISGKTESQKRDAINKFYEFISLNGYTDSQTLVLLSCNVGNGLTKTLGEYIAAHPNIGTVYAPTSLTWYSSADPSVSSYARWIHPDTGMKTLPEKKLMGHFRIFNSATTVRSSR